MFCQRYTIYEFWSSDKLTGSQTGGRVQRVDQQFWSSDKLTGSQTAAGHHPRVAEFWSSDKLTGSQTCARSRSWKVSFGAVTN